MNSPFSLEGKTILVTGSSSNIGRKIAIRCSEMGAKVIVSARDEERMKATVADMMGDGHCYYSVDLSNAESIAVLADALPVLDGMVLCAAQFDSTPVKNIKRELVHSMFETNTFANFDLVQKMLRMKKISKGGSIVFISSVASIRPYKGNSLYSATKGAINSFSKVLATELGAKKIRVNCIHPGIVCRDEGVREGALTVEQQREEMAKFPLGMGETDDIAYAVVYLLSNVSKWITGIDLIVDGGQSLI
jgi:NAD(P)-dependent dehydrogenase (short-subunit alcohol dehydrogenase family)